MNTIQIEVNNRELDLDNLLEQVPEEMLMKAVRNRSTFNPAFSVSEISEMAVFHFRPLMCKVFGISEHSDDTIIMSNFKEKCKISTEMVSVTINNNA